MQRVAQRIEQGGHNIPLQVILRRHSKGSVNLFSVYRPLLNCWTLYDNTHSPGQVIAEEEKGQLRVYDQEEFAKINREAQSQGDEC